MKRTPLIYDKAMHGARKHWREQIESMSFGQYLALDHPRPRSGEQRVSSFSLLIDKEIHALLQRVTSDNLFLSYTVMVLALRIACYRHTGDPKVTIFSPSTTQEASGNLLPIGGMLDENSSFKSALLATKESLSKAYENQKYPLSRMLQDCPEWNRPDHIFLIASMAGFHEVIPDGKSDIVVFFETVFEGTKVTCKFDSLLYDEPTLLRFVNLFSAIVHQGMTAMTSRIADIAPGCDRAAERPEGTAHLPLSITGVNGVKKGRTGCHRLDHLIAVQAKGYPDHAAMIEGERKFTHKMLDDYASQLAQRLMDLRVDPRKPVVIFMDASIEMVASMLAAMKIGVSFALMTSASMGGAVTEKCRRLGAECIICQRQHLERFQQSQDTLSCIRHVITLERGAPAADHGKPPDIARYMNVFMSETPVSDVMAARSLPAAHSKTIPCPDEKRCGSAAACVLGVGRDEDLLKSLVTHDELATVFNWVITRCGISAADRCLLSRESSPCEVLFGTLGILSAGGSVEIADAASPESTPLLVKQLLAPEITVWNLPAPHMQNLLPSLFAFRENLSAQAGPRSILLTGEKQTNELSDELAQRFPNARIVGLYESPSVGIWSTAFSLNNASPDSNDAAIAQCILGFEHHVLNKNLQPVPFGATGELCLRRLLSADESDLIPTGLRARRLEDGLVGWLRGDDHCFVKYGCGVELTNIEAVLCQDEHIRAAEVIALKQGRETEREVAAFIIAEPGRMSGDAARDFLVLHGHVDLIPDRFIFVENFPLRADGSIDRDALIGHMASHEQKVVPPDIGVSEIITQLKRIWLDVLQLEGADDNESFFALGGNSLKATLLIARIRDQFAVEVSVQSFFRQPTVKAVAQLIESATKIGQTAKNEPEFRVVPREKYRVRLSGIESRENTPSHGEGDDL